MDGKKVVKPIPVWHSFKKTPLEKLELKKAKKECGNVTLTLVATITL